MAHVHVEPGICGFTTEITAVADDDLQVKVSLTSDCEAIKAMEADLQELDGYTEVLGKWGSSTVAKAARLHCHHAACPVPAAILKGIEVACVLALPKDVVMRISKE
ncbi:MAG: hypothetical protein WCG80_08785 [Spirochaetales bacterium]